ncbi:hypothetical protein VTO73DRAFT_9058 [Trametes versicolor]
MACRARLPPDLTHARPARPNSVSPPTHPSWLPSTSSLSCPAPPHQPSTFALPTQTYSAPHSLCVPLLPPVHLLVRRGRRRRRPPVAAVLCSIRRVLCYERGNQRGVRRVLHRVLRDLRAIERDQLSGEHGVVRGEQYLEPPEQRDVGPRHERGKQCWGELDKQCGERDGPGGRWGECWGIGGRGGSVGELVGAGVALVEVVVAAGLVL